MKILLKILLFIVLSLWILGVYFHFTNNPLSVKCIGIGVLLLTLVLMPLFIYHRYKDKDMDVYRLDLFQNSSDKKEE